MHGACGSKGPNRKAGDQVTVTRPTLDDDARWRVAAELVEALRDAGYECELRVEQDFALAGPISELPPARAREPHDRALCESSALARA